MIFRVFSFALCLEAAVEGRCVAISEDFLVLMRCVGCAERCLAKTATARALRVGFGLDFLFFMRSLCYW